MPHEPLDAPKLPAWATKEGQGRRRAYHLALGRFIDMFSKTEMAAQMALWHYARTPAEIARAAFGSLRVDGTVAAIRRLLTVRDDIDQSLAADLESILAQLLVINRVRNDMLHYGAHSVEEGLGVISNAPLAYVESAIREHPISPTILEAMFADLRKILLRLLSRHMVQPMIDATGLEPIFDAPWLYTPPPQGSSRPRAGKTEGSSSRGKRQRRRHQRSASPE